MSEPVNICFSTDDNYVDYTAISCLSILRNSSKEDNYHFFIISQALSSTGRKKLRKLEQLGNCVFSFHKISSRAVSIFQRAPKPKHIANLECYNRLLLPLILNNVDRILYLDSDLIAIAPIRDLFYSDLQGKYIGAVEDVNPRLKVSLGYPDRFPYCNSGVLLMDLAALRQINYMDVLKQSIEKNSGNYEVGGDQDVLNDCFYDKIHLLSYRYNMFHEWHGCRKFFTPSESDDYTESVKNPCIIHFVGPIKPWQKDCKRPYTDKYLEYQSLYKELSSSSLKNYLYREKKDEIQTEIRVLGFPYDVKKNEEGTRIHKRVFGLFETRKNHSSRKYYAFGIPLLALSKSPEKKEIRIIGCRIYNQNKIDGEVKVIGFQIRRPTKRMLDHHPVAALCNVQKQLDEIEKLLHTQLDIVQTRCVNDVLNLHQKTFSSYKNRYQGKEMVLLGSGPTNACYEPIPDAIHVGVNRSFLKEDVSLDYLFIQDKRAFNDGFYDKILQYRGNSCKKFFGILSENFSEWIIPESWAIQANAARYYTSIGLKQRFALDLSAQYLGDFASVCFSALQFMLWCNPRKIYLVGCDCSNAPYAYDKTKKTDLVPGRLIRHYQEFKKFAQLYYPEIDIISINPVGLKGVFKDSYTKGYSYLNA